MTIGRFFQIAPPTLKISFFLFSFELDRFCLELTPKQLDELKKIESETGESKAEIVRNALRLYAYVARRAFAGDKFQVIDKNKRATDVVFIELT